MKRVLLALGDQPFHDIIRKGLSTYPDDFHVLQRDVFHRNYLMDVATETSPDIILVHDYYLQSDFVEEEDREQEWITLIQELKRWKDDVRVVFICERSRYDAFLQRLIQWHVQDIFHTRQFELIGMVQQLREPPRFANVRRFLSPDDEPLPQTHEEEDIEESESPNSTANVPSPVKEAAEQMKERMKQLSLAISSRKKPPADESPNSQDGRSADKEKEMKRSLELSFGRKETKVVGVEVPHILIGIVGLKKRVGSTFISHMISKVIADQGVSTVYLENPFREPYTFDRFFGAQQHPEYESMYREIARGSSYPNYETWNLEDVELVPLHSHTEKAYSEKELSFYDIAKVLMAVQNRSVIVFDIGEEYDHPVMQELLPLMTHLLVVTDGDIPSLVQLNEEAAPGMRLVKNLLHQEKASLVLNQGYEKGVRELVEEMNLILPFSVPTFEAAWTFEAQLQGDFYGGKKDFRRHVEAALQPIGEMLLPKQYHKKKRKQWLSLPKVKFLQ